MLLALVYGVILKLREKVSLIWQIILVSNVSLPIGGILACIFIGWVWKTDNAVKEITNNGKVQFKLAPVWSALIKFVLPVVIAVVFVTSL